MEKRVWVDVRYVVGAFFQKSVRETIFVHTRRPKGGFGGLSFTSHRSKKSVSLSFDFWKHKKQQKHTQKKLVPKTKRGTNNYAGI